MSLSKVLLELCSEVFEDRLITYEARCDVFELVLDLKLVILSDGGI